MKIAVLGSTGQLGSSIVSIGTNKGYTVIGYSREQLDITDVMSCRAQLQKASPDIIINCAAYHVVPDCEKFPEEAFRVNTIGQKNLAVIANEIHATIVYISTDKVFDGNTNIPYVETDKTNPIQMYGLTKLAGELVTSNTNPAHYIIRTNGVYGGRHGSRAKNGNFVLYIVKQSQQVKELEIASDQYANFIYTEDLAESIFTLIEKRAAYGLYHIVHDGYASWAEFAQEIVRQLRSTLVIKPIRRSGFFSGVPTPAFCVLDISKAKDAGLSISTWQKGLQRYITFLQSSS